MKKILLLILSFCGVIAASAQSKYQISLPGSNATTIIQNPSGNFVVAGYVFPTGTYADVLIYEIDSASGNVIRSKQFTSTLLNIPSSICNTPDGNYLITGYISATNNDNDLFVAKLDTGFNVIWYHQLGITASGSNDYGNSVAVVDSGLYAVTGTVAIGGSAKPSIIYLNDSGNVVKEFHLNTNQFASPSYKAKLLNNGNFGFVHLTNDICIVDTAGTILKNDASNYGIYTTDILRNSNGTYATLALSDYGSGQGSSATLCLYDSSVATVLFKTKISVATYDLEPQQLILDNGNYLLSGNITAMSTGASTGILIKIDSTGNLIWAKKFTPASISESSFSSLMLSADGSYVVAGNEGSYPNYQFYVVKMDTSGDVCESVPVNVTVSVGVKSNMSPHSITTGTINLISSAIPGETSGTGNSTALCSGPTFITENPENLSSLYPNPSTNILHIESAYNEESIVTIYGIEGKIISTQRLNKNGDLDIHSLSSGVYILRIDVHGKMVSQQKFVKY